MPAGANLLADTTYPYSVVALGQNGQISPVVNSFGTTLLANNAPTNMIGGSKSFTGVVSVPANTAVSLNDQNGNALSAGDGSNAETLTIKFEPTAGNFGTISFSNNPALPGTVTVTGGGINGNPIQISGPKDAVNTALNNFVYTPQNGFIGNATVTMTAIDTVEGAGTPDDIDTIVFSVNSATPSAPRNLMNNNPSFSTLLTAVNSPITLKPLNNSGLTVEDTNGDTLTTVLTPTNGTLALVSIPAGVTVTGTGTNADPFKLVGPPHFINAALNGGLTLTPTANFNGAATIQMVTTATDGTDTDLLTVNVVAPSNLFNGSNVFPTSAQRMAKAATTTLNGASNKALTVLYPPTSTVKVNLDLQDSAGNNTGAAANGSLTLAGIVPGTVTVTGGGTAALQLQGPIADVNTLLTAGVIYSPQGNNTGTYKLRMNSVDVNNNVLTDTNDVVTLEVSEPPVNKYNNSATSFPPVGAPVELGFNTPLTFASFFGTALSVTDADSATVTTTLTPSNNGTLSRANLNAIPAGVTVTVGTTVASSTNNVSVTATNAQPMVIAGSPTNINLFLNNGIVFSPTTNFSGAATVTMATNDGGATDTDIVHINVLPTPENRRNDNATFTTTAIPAAPGVQENLGTPATRLLTIKNYPSAANVDVTLSVPTGKGTLLLNGFPAPNGTQGGVTFTGNGTTSLSMTGTQANINTALTNLRYTPAAGVVAAPETVTMTMSSTGGTLGDSGDTVPFSISNPPRNIYNTQDGNPVADDTAENASFPSAGARLDIFGNQALILNNTATATQPAVKLDVIDDSSLVTVTLTPANTGGNTNAIIDLTGAAPGTVSNTGAGTNASPRVISGPLADVKTALTLLRYTPQTGFTGATSFDIKVDDGGPSPDTNTVNLNVKVRPQNAFNNNATFPSTNVLIFDFAGIANPLKNDTANSDVNTAPQLHINETVHPLSVLNLSAYTQPTDTATVRLQIPSGVLNVTLSGSVTISAGANGSGDLTLSATGANIPNINTVLGTLTWTPAHLNDGAPLAAPAVLTMTSGPIPDTDTLNLLSTRTPRNLYGGNLVFTTTALQVNEGQQMLFDGGGGHGLVLSVGSQSSETVEDSPQIRVKLIPSLVGGTNSGTVNVTLSGAATKTGSGTNASPLIITGTPVDVNATLATMTFNSTAGVNGSASIAVKTTDFAAEDATGPTADSIVLDIRAKPANRWNVGTGSETNTFPGTGSPINVGLNATFAMNTANNRQLGAKFYQNGDTIDVTLKLSNATHGNLTASSSGGAIVSNSGTDTITIHSTGANSLTDLNAALATLVFNSVNSGGVVDLEMTSTNGTASDSTVGQDVIRFNVQNSTPVNSLTGTTSGFTTGATALPLNLVSDTTTVDDRLDFGQSDPTSAAAGTFTVTGNTWPTLSVSDDDSSVTSTLTPPIFGTLSDRLGTNFAGSGAGIAGSGTNADPFVFTGTPAQINAALLRLRFTPNANVTDGTVGNLVISTKDGANQTDTDNIALKVERPTLPSTFGGNPNPAGTIFRAVYQFGRDKLPQIVVNDITVSGPEIQAGAQIEIIRYNDNDPTTAADDNTTVLRTVTLNNPNTALGESVSFNNITNRATVTVNFSAAGSPVLAVPPAAPNLKDGTGKIGGRLVNGNVDTPSTSSVTAANHPWFFFVYPERAQYAVEDYLSGANNRGRWYLINTSTSIGAGLGRLSMVFDSNGALNIQNGLNNTSDVTAGLAKNPINGDVYYVDQQGTSPNFSGRLIRWIPSLGIQDGASTGDPFLVRGNLSVNNGLGLSYNFGDKPARLVFNSTINGATKTATLYAGAAYDTVDGQGSLSGFYRVRNFESGTPAIDHIKLMLNAEEFGLNVSYLNNGDFVFEPDTDNTAAANNRMFLTNNNKLYVTTAPVPDTGTADVAIQELSLAGVANTLKSAGGTTANQLVGLSIDGEWAAGSRSLLVIARYPAPDANIARLYRLTYSSADYSITGATLLANGNFATANYGSDIPLVDITAAHLP